MERSIMPDIMTIVMPNAITPFSETFLSMFIQLPSVMKVGLASHMATTRSTSSTSMM